MKVKALILTLSAFMLLGCSGVTPVKAEGEKDIPGDLKALITSYIGEGTYTKKTTICLNDPAGEEVIQYFHAKQTDPKRTTYYDDNGEQLLMAEPDGSLDSSYGGYRLVDDKIYRFTSKEDTTLDNMFDGEHINQQKSYSYSDKSHLYDVFVNLTKLSADGYFEDTDWVYSEQYKQYTHDINPKEGETENANI